MQQCPKVCSCRAVTHDAPTPVLCPCCTRPLEPAHMQDARPGDLWCEPCEWLLIRELLAGGVEPARCPTHQVFRPDSSRVGLQCVPRSGKGCPTDRLRGLGPRRRSRLLDPAWRPGG